MWPGYLCQLGLRRLISSCRFLCPSPSYGRSLCSNWLQDRELLIYDVVVILNTFSQRFGTDGQIRDSKLAPEYVLIIHKMCRIILTNM